MARRWVLALAGLLLLCLARASGEDETECPFEYQRHDMQSILDGKVRPWLWVSVAGSGRVQLFFGHWVEFIAVAHGSRMRLHRRWPLVARLCAARRGRVD